MLHFAKYSFNDVKITSVLIEKNFLMLPQIKDGTDLFVYAQFVYTFYQETLRPFILFSFRFSTLTITYFR